MCPHWFLHRSNSHSLLSSSIGPALSVAKKLRTKQYVFSSAVKELVNLTTAHEQGLSSHLLNGESLCGENKRGKTWKLYWFYVVETGIM